MTEYRTTLRNNEPIAITLGNFDGIHRGHQRLLAELRVLAKRLDCLPVLVTFDPHTLTVVRPEIEVRYLTTLEEKLALAAQYGGVANSIVIPFTKTVAAQDANTFMDELCEHFTIKGIVVGSDFSLGHNRMGDVAFLKHYGQEHRIEVEAISLEQSDQVRISSTRIRTLLSEGRVAEANELLGHPMIVSGIVAHGDRRGQQLGFPTANLRPDPHKFLPLDGVYVVEVQIQNDQERDSELASCVYKGVANIGIRPTFGQKERLIEVHLLDMNKDLYDKKMIVAFIERIRGEQRFPNVDALKDQIATDVRTAQQIFTMRRVSH